MSYFNYNKRYVLCDLDMVEGWRLFSYAVINDPVNKFSGIKMKDSYSSREADKLFEELKKMSKKQQDLMISRYYHPQALL